jgi:hypothetical protein
MAGTAAEACRSVHWPAKPAAVAASPITPGRSTPASAMASTAATTASRAIGVSVAWNVSGDWNTTPTTAPASATTQ